MRWWPLFSPLEERKSEISLRRCRWPVRTMCCNFVYFLSAGIGGCELIGSSCALFVCNLRSLGTQYGVDMYDTYRYKTNPIQCTRMNDCGGTVTTKKTYSSPWGPVGWINVFVRGMFGQGLALARTGYRRHFGALRVAQGLGAATLLCACMGWRILGSKRDEKPKANEKKIFSSKVCLFNIILVMLPVGIRSDGSEQFSSRESVRSSCSEQVANQSKFELLTPLNILSSDVRVIQQQSHPTQIRQPSPT